MLYSCMKNMSKATKKYDLMGFLIELCGLPYSRPVAKNMLSLKDGNDVTYQSSSLSRNFLVILDKF